MMLKPFAPKAFALLTTFLLPALVAQSSLGANVPATTAATKRSVRADGILDPAYIAVSGTPVATVISCERSFSERERLDQCQQKLTRAADALKLNGITILYAIDCRIDNGPNRFCSPMDSIPRAIGSITFTR